MAKRQNFTLGGTQIAPGQAETVDLPVSVMADHTPVDLSVFVRHGTRVGPVVFLSAGIHGDEVIGVEIIRRVLNHPTLPSLAGTLMAVPIVNTFGFINHSRYLPDRRDLNRSFPGSEGGSLASRLAHHFMTEIVAKADLGIDLHSAAIHRTNYPQIRISPDDTRMEELARIFGAPIVMRSDLREGSLRQCAKDVGTDVLLYEAGEGLRFDELAIRAGVLGILRVLRHLRMLPAKGISRPKGKPQFCPSSKWLRAPAGGLLRIYRSDGDLVEEGEVLAAVSDPFGKAEQVIEAPFSGIIVGRAVMPIVNEGDAVFHLGRVTSVAAAEDAVEDLSAQLSDDPMFYEDEII